MTESEQTNPPAPTDQVETPEAESTQPEGTPAATDQPEATEADAMQPEAAGVAAEPAPNPAEVLEQLSAQPLADAEATLTALAAERSVAALPTLALIAQQGALPLAMKAMSLVASLRTQEAADALAAIGVDRNDAQRAKEARRSLHRLSLAGIKPATTTSVARTEPQPDKVYACLASPIGGDGTRSVTVVRQNRFGTLRMGVFLMNENLGLVDVLGADPCSMTLWKSYLADATSDDAKAVPVELAFCQQQIETATARSQRNKMPLPDRYYSFYTLAAGPSEERARPAELAPDTVQANSELLSKSAALFDLPECHDWHLEPEEVRPYALKIIAEQRRQEQIEQDRRQDLSVMDLGQLQREGTVISVAMNELFDGARRSLFKERLEYTADILWRSERLEQAQWAMAAALALAPESTLPLDQHPFVRAVVTDSLDESVKAEEAGGTAGSAGREGGAAKSPLTQPDEYVDEQGLIRRKSGLILPK